MKFFVLKILISAAIGLAAWWGYMKWRKCQNAKGPDVTDTELLDMLKEINFCRTKPKEYAKMLEDKYLTQTFAPNIPDPKFPDKPDKKYPWEIQNPSAEFFTVSGVTHHIPLKEGKEAVNECIKRLKKAKPVKPLTLNHKICLAAKDHLDDCIKRGKMDHPGSDGKKCDTRMKRRGYYYSMCSENLGLGAETIRGMVANLLIDDNVANRGHYYSLMSDKPIHVGLAIGRDPEKPDEAHRKMCVQNFGA